MEKKLDLRIQKTYLARTAALLSMMEEKRFEDIRIGELCDRAMVRKSTFYKHFGDKYELLAFVVRQKQESLNARLAAQRVEGDTVEYYTRLIGLVFDFLADNEALVRTAIQSNSFPLILSILSEQIIRDIQQQLKGDARRGEKLPAPPEVMAPFFVGGILETAHSCLKRGKPLNGRELQNQLGVLLTRFYQSPGAAPEPAQ